jgi:hypothetical protein
MSWGDFTKSTMHSDKTVARSKNTNSAVQENGMPYIRKQKLKGIRNEK